MSTYYDYPSEERSRGYRTSRRSKRNGRNETEDGFQCKHCHNFVSSLNLLSGVQNRNHCPYCLWSRHVDLFAAGDRLSACKAPMRPLGLTIKSTHKKYGPRNGELMLIHLCTDCGQFSINRIAADDNAETLMELFENSHQLEAPLVDRLRQEGICLLDAASRPMVLSQLFGESDNDLAESLFLRKEEMMPVPCEC